MVTIGGTAAGAGDLESVEDVGDEAVRLGDEVVGRLHVAAKPSGANEGANEEAAVGRVALADGVVDVHLTVLRVAGGEGEVGEAGELELVGEGGFNVADGRELLPDAVLTAEGEVGGVLTLTADEEGEATHAATLNLLVESVDLLGELGAKVVLLGDGEGGVYRDGDVADVPLRLGRLLGLHLAVGVVAEGVDELLAEVGEALDREHGSVANGLLLALREKVGEVGEGGGALRGESRGGSGGRRLGGGLAHAEGPGDGGGLVLLGIALDVVDVDEVVGFVRATNVSLEGGESDPRVRVVEEDGEDVENGEAAVDDILEDFGARVASDGTGLAVDGLRNGGLEDLLELDEALVEGGKLAVDEDLASLERDLGSRLGVELGEIL